MPRSTSVHVALLRGINVGGKNKLLMKDLAALFADAGCAPVKTYIQSGNVAFGASASLARRVPATIKAAIAEHHGLDVPVITRSLAELRAVAVEHPLLGDVPEAEHKLYYVGFLGRQPDAARVAELDPDRSLPDRFELRGREIYIAYPGGSARSKLDNAYFDRVLDTVSTLRNWRTINKLLALAETLA